MMRTALERRIGLVGAATLWGAVLVLIHQGNSVCGGEPAGSESGPHAHWAFQPVRPPQLPAVQHAEWPSSPVDYFVLAQLEREGLAPSRAADRRTLIRRASFDLLGLPPDPSEIDGFLNDPAPNSVAFAALVDRYLDSPRFGERWGRFWLDVARYADTKGYIFTEERRFPYSHTYRDWVIRAFNEDLPYDRFLLEQIAADQLELGDDKRPLAALGFLTLGRRFLGNMHDIIDDRIDVVTRGTMGLTVQCARCHDHKYDPIPTADYYSLYGVFASTQEKQIPIAAATPEFETELQSREAELNEFLETTLTRTLHKLRTQVGEYLLAAESLKDHPDIQEFMFVDNPGDINRFALGRWRTYLELTSKQHHPVWAPWFAFAAIPATEFAEQAPALARSFITDPDSNRPIQPLVARAFQDPPPQSLKQVADRYGRLFADVEAQWHKSIADAKAAGMPQPKRLDDPDAEQLREILYKDDSPTAVPKRKVDDLFEKPDADKIRALRKKVQEWRTSPDAPPNAMALVDGDTLVNPAIFVRGNPAHRGGNVPRQFPALLAGPERKPFQTGSGRLEMARAIAHRDNPLTPRVYVNRVWINLFGNGLVRTPSDFGLRSDPPSHPDLLDWLAHTFIENGWSTKKLIRLVMLSQTYQQASGLRESESAFAARLKAADTDPENRLIWRQNRRRLDFESTRDAIISVAGDIDFAMAGTSVDLAKPPFSRRRTVYGFIERQNLPGMFRTFDFASPDTHCPQRFRTTVPQQALFLMNSPWVIEQARRLASHADVAAAQDSELRIQRLYRRAYGRAASSDEISLACAFVADRAADAPGDTAPAPELSRWEQLAQVLLLSNEFMFVD